jgi:two-component system CheB/CheR fusion protein
VAEVRAAARPCITGEAEHTEVTLDAVNRRGKKIRCRLSCTPLVGADGARAGVILLMEDAGSPAA